MIGIGHGIADSGYNPDGRTSIEIMEEAEKTVFNLGTREKGLTKEPRLIKFALKASVDAAEKRHDNKDKMFGRPTGFIDLDAAMQGMVNGNLTIVAGRPSMGKTTFAMNVAENVAVYQKELVIVFSLEMPEWKLTDRMVCSVSMIDNTRYRKGELHNEDWDKLSMGLAKLKGAPLYIDDDQSMTSDQLGRRARRIVMQHGAPPALIVLDYLQLLNDEQMRGDSSGTNRVTRISRNLKRLALEMGCPVWALSQLNRSLEDRPDKRPKMRDLRDSGAIEQDADEIIFVYRDEVYNKDTNQKGIADLIIGKNRDGELSTVKVSAYLSRNRFDNLAPFHRKQYPQGPIPIQKSWMDDQ